MSNGKWCTGATVWCSWPRLHMKSGQGLQHFNPIPPDPLKIFHGDRKSQYLRQMTSCGMAMPWDCTDYSDSLNKHGPINHFNTLSNLAHNSGAHLLFCHAECVFLHGDECMHISTWNACIVYLYSMCMHPLSLLRMYFQVIYYQNEPWTHQLSGFDSKPVSTDWLVEDTEG